MESKTDSNQHQSAAVFDGRPFAGDIAQTEHESTQATEPTCVGAAKDSRDSAVPGVSFAADGGQYDPAGGLTSKESAGNKEFQQNTGFNRHSPTQLLETDQNTLQSAQDSTCQSRHKGFLDSKSGQNQMALLNVPAENEPLSATDCLLQEGNWSVTMENSGTAFRPLTSETLTSVELSQHTNHTDVSVMSEALPVNDDNSRGDSVCEIQQPTFAAKKIPKEKTKPATGDQNSPDIPTVRQGTDMRRIERPSLEGAAAEDNSTGARQKTSWTPADRRASDTQVRPHEAALAVATTQDKLSANFSEI